MISLGIPYMLTFIGIIIGGVHDFMGMAVFLTVIGVLWTAIACAVKKYSRQGFLIAEAVHAVIWIICKFFPMFGAKLLGGAVGLAVAIVLILLVYAYFFAPSDDDGERHANGKKLTPAHRLPKRIYDDGNNPWECTWRSNTSQEADYINKNTGETIRIYHYSISGNSAQTDKGTFRWH